MDGLESVQAAVSASVAEGTMHLQSGMAASLINGTIDKNAEMQELARAAGLAAEGLGSRLSATV